MTQLTLAQLKSAVDTDLDDGTLEMFLASVGGDVLRFVGGSDVPLYLERERLDVQLSMSATPFVLLQAGDAVVGDPIIDGSDEALESVTLDDAGGITFGTTVVDEAGLTLAHLVAGYSLAYSRGYGRRGLSTTAYTLYLVTAGAMYSWPYGLFAAGVGGRGGAWTLKAGDARRATWGAAFGLLAEGAKARLALAAAGAYLTMPTADFRARLRQVELDLCRILIADQGLRDATDTVEELTAKLSFVDVSSEYGKRLAQLRSVRPEGWF